MTPRERFLAAAVVALVTGLVFVRTLGCHFVAFDDPKTVLENVHIRDFSAANLRWMFTADYMGHWHPLTWLTLALDWQLWHGQPGGFHLQNLLWHTLSAVLVFVLLRSLLPGDDRRTLWAAVAGALFWSIHPLRVESVAWITERRDVVSGAFFLLALLGYLRRTLPGLALAFVAMGLSLLGKAWAITLPVLFLALDVWPLRRRFDTWQIWLEKLLFFFLAALVAGFALKAQSAGGALASLEEVAVWRRIGNALFGLVFYPFKTLFPFDLVPIYEMSADSRIEFTRYAAGLTFTTMITIGLWWQRRRAPAGLAAWVCYGILVSPVLGLAQSGAQAVADRYSYLAALPFAALFGLFVQRFAISRWLVPPWLAGLALGSVLQCGMWHDAETLWRETLVRQPHNATANYNLGLIALDAGDLASAERLFRRALDTNPRDPLTLNNLATLLFQTGREREAIGLWQRAIRWRGAEDAQRNLDEVRKRRPELFR